MVAPITGPKSRNIDTGYFQEITTWFTQKRPYNLVLDYHSRKGYSGAATNPENSPSYGSYWGHLASQQSTAKAYNDAYAKLISKLGDPAGLGITLAQWKQADTMIRNRGNQLVSFTNHLVRRNPLGVAVSLGISLRDCQAIMRTRYGVARKLSDLWLEFWFGWKPMVSDIYTACEVFDRDIPWGIYKGVRKLPYWVDFPPPTPWGAGTSYSGFTRASLGINVRIKNPNVRLLQQFGLLNPAQVLWDAVPWSFVVDWFGNVSSWLGSFTDFAGLETANGYVKTSATVGGRVWIPMRPEWGATGHGSSVDRSNVETLPRPDLLLRGVSLKPARALTAITLLTQKLPR